MNDITTEGVKHLLNLPKKIINKLKILDLSKNHLHSESCAVLAHLISHMPHLKMLELSFNCNIGQGGAVLLITSLTADNSLEKFGLGTTGIGVEDCCYYPSLKVLDIGWNDLPPEAVELIISGFHHNTTLKKLDMWDSYFSLQNTISLVLVLRTNHTLVILDLGKCNIDSDGACQLASAMCTNDTLQELGLRYNPIGVKGAIAFAEMLLKNRSLRHLNLQDDSIGEEGVLKLIDSLTHNTTVKELVFHEKYKSSITKSGTDRRVWLK